MFENPSAGKFVPPPENERREREQHEREQRGLRPARRKQWVLVALGLAYLGLEFGFRTSTGRTAAIVALLGVVLLVAQHVIGRQVRDERGGPEPYSAPTRITR